MFLYFALNLSSSHTLHTCCLLMRNHTHLNPIASRYLNIACLFNLKIIMCPDLPLQLFSPVTHSCIPLPVSVSCLPVFVFLFTCSCFLLTCSYVQVYLFLCPAYLFLCSGLPVPVPCLPVPMFRFTCSCVLLTFFCVLVYLFLFPAYLFLCSGLPVPVSCLPVSVFWFTCSCSPRSCSLLICSCVLVYLFLCPGYLFLCSCLPVPVFWFTFSCVLVTCSHVPLSKIPTCLPAPSPFLPAPKDWLPGFDPRSLRTLFCLLCIALSAWLLTITSALSLQTLSVLRLFADGMTKSTYSSICVSMLGFRLPAHDRFNNNILFYSRWYFLYVCTILPDFLNQFLSCFGSYACLLGSVVCKHTLHFINLREFIFFVIVGEFTKTQNVIPMKKQIRCS